MEQDNQPKSNEKYIPFLHCISSFVGTSYKNFEIQPPNLFLFFLFLLAFTSAGINFLKFLELHSTFLTNFPFLTDLFIFIIVVYLFIYFY